jgi:hypothetical protein
VDSVVEDDDIGDGGNEEEGGDVLVGESGTIRSIFGVMFVRVVGVFDVINFGRIGHKSCTVSFKKNIKIPFLTINLSCNNIQT